METQIVCADCLEYMETMEANSIDAIVTDPPYGLEFMGKDWDKLKRFDRRDKNKKSASMNRDNAPIGTSPTYVGGKDAQEWHYAWAVEALRIAKPGCHLLAFGGTRTFHRLTCAIEDAGWEIRDCLGWIYGSGFPKSHNVGLRMDKLAGHGDRGHRIAVANRRHPDGTLEPNGELLPPYEAKTEDGKKWQGWGTALKPAWEPVILARKPLEGTVAANVQKWGTGAVNVDGCRVGVADWGSRPPRTPNELYGGGRGTNLTASEAHQGRWPANIIHDGSDEVLELFPQTGPGMFPPKRGDGQVFGKSYGADQPTHKTDSGSAARFFYCAKASRKEREAGLEGMEEREAIKFDGGEFKSASTIATDRKARNHHPTVKPVALMRYLCRLVTPPNGLILDPFCGSGSTGIAAKLEGFRFIGIDNNEEYCEIARKRIGA